MKHVKFLVALAALSLMTVAPALANSIQVVGPGQGLGGTGYSLLVTADGGTDKAYVETTTPSEEQVFRAEFRLLITSGLNLDVGKVLEISIAFGTNVPSRNLKIGIQKIANGNYRVWGYARNNATGLLFPYVVFNMVPDADTQVGIEWQVASAADNDGIVRLYKNGVLRSERTDVASFGNNIDRIRFGAPIGSAATGAAGGTYTIDEVALFRSLTP